MTIRVEDIRAGEGEEYGPGEVIFTQGESANHMYLVLEGEVELRIGGSPVATVGSGAVMGEMAILESQPRSAMAVAVGDVRLLPVNRSRFVELVKGNPEFARTVLRTLAHRLRRMNMAAGGLSGPGVATGSTTARLLAATRGFTGFAAGATIFDEGVPGTSMFIVQSGTVEIRVAGNPVGTVTTGGFFGEMALLEDEPRSASAHAQTDCRLLPVDRDKFAFLIQRTPDFVLEMMRVMAARLRNMNRESRG